MSGRTKIAKTPAPTHGDPPAAPAAAPRRMGSTTEALGVLGVSYSTLKNYAKDPTFPKPIRLNTRVMRWDLAAIERWMETKRTA